MRYRVMKTLRREILSQHADAQEPIVIVCHAGPIRAIMSALEYVPDEEAWARDIQYGSVNIIDSLSDC
jgi:broad specificity phosphatase PhoE